MQDHSAVDDGIFRVYTEAGPDGYPSEWHIAVKHIVRRQAGNRCLRCLHPYAGPRPLNDGWSPCDGRCRHSGPMRVWTTEGWSDFHPTPEACGAAVEAVGKAEAAWRILTVHHLNGAKFDCRWWNLAALCQRCHLTIQGKVLMEREFIRAHSEWFKPYAAGWYAKKYLDLDLTRAETMARLDELLDLELAERSLF